LPRVLHDPSGIGPGRSSLHVDSGGADLVASLDAVTVMGQAD